MITKTSLMAQIDQLAVAFRDETWSPEEIATLATAVGLEWAAMGLRATLTTSEEARRATAAELDRLRAELVGEETPDGQ